MLTVRRVIATHLSFGVTEPTDKTSEQTQWRNPGHAAEHPAMYPRVHLCMPSPHAIPCDASDIPGRSFCHLVVTAAPVDYDQTSHKSPDFGSLAADHGPKKK